MELKGKTSHNFALTIFKNKNKKDTKLEIDFHHLSLQFNYFKTSSKTIFQQIKIIKPMVTFLINPFVCQLNKTEIAALTVRAEKLKFLVFE